jgi:predicted DNA-binding transcriptional regulator YafY
VSATPKRNCKELVATEVPASNSVLADSDEFFDFKIKSRSKYLTERYGDLFTDVTQEGDTYLAEGRMSNSQWLRRLVLSNAPDLELLEPAFLKEEIQDEMQLVLRLYQ